MLEEASHARQYDRSMLRHAICSVGCRMVKGLRTGDRAKLGEGEVVVVSVASDKDGKPEGVKVLAYLPPQSRRLQLLWLPEGAVRSQHGGYVPTHEGVFELYPATDEVRVLFARSLRGVMAGFEQFMHSGASELAKAKDELDEYAAEEEARGQG